MEDRLLLATFTVTNTDDSGGGSLRQAIVDADAAGDGSVVAFDIPGAGVHTIVPQSALPPISAAITLDGFRQPGAKANTNAVGDADNAVLLIEIRGASGTGGNGLTITGHGAAIKGLVIDGFQGNVGAGVGIDVAAAGVTIAGNSIGIGPDGQAALLNTYGIEIETGASGLTIGGTTPADRNVIAGNIYDIFARQVTGVSGLVIVGNYIGVSADGVTGARAGGATAVDGGINLDSASTGLTIGGTSPGSGNVFGAQVQIYSWSDIVIEGSYFDTNRNLPGRIAENSVSLGIFGCDGVTIGGPAVGAGNVFACPVTVGANFLTITTGIVIQGNSFGTDATGTIPLGVGDINTNPVYGGALSLSDTPGALVGGTGPNEENKFAFVNGQAMFIDTRGFQNGALVLGNSVYANVGRGLFFPDAAATAPISDDLLPQLSSVTATSVTGTFRTGANRPIRIEFFASPVAAPGSTLVANQDRQGQTFLGVVEVTADASGTAAFTFSPPTPITGDQYITCTASSTSADAGFTLGYSRGLLLSGSSPVEPTIVSTSTLLAVDANPAGFGQNLTFTAVVDATSGASLPTGSVTFAIDGIAQSPLALTLVDGHELATLTTSTLAAGSHTVVAAYGGAALFGPSASGPLSLVVNSAPEADPTPAPTSSSAPPSDPRGDGPAVESIERFGYHDMPTTLVLAFSKPLDSARARNPNNYRIMGPSGHMIGIQWVRYDESTRTVTMRPRDRLNVHWSYRLRVVANSLVGVTDADGRGLNSTETNIQGNDYFATIDRRILVIKGVHPAGSRALARARRAPVVRH